MSRLNERLDIVVSKLNVEYPKFLKAIPTLKNKEVFKHPLMVLLTELKTMLTKESYE